MKEGSMVVLDGKELFGVGDLMRRHGVPIHRIEHILNTRADIRPLPGDIGGRRVYDAAADARVAEELKSGRGK